MILALLLVGCPNPNDLETVRSTSVSTQEIGIDLHVEQDEENDEVSIRVVPYLTDGFSIIANINVWTGDDMQATVLNQDIEVTARDGGTGFNFTVKQSSLRLPATFRLQFLRDGGQEKALDTYVTINALFETMSPTEGAVFSRDEMVEFEWTLRDGDGNSIDTPFGIDEVWTRVDGPPGSRSLTGNPTFTSVGLSPNGFSKIGSLPATALVPTEALESGASAWDMTAYLSQDRGRITIPVLFDVDPIFANKRTIGLFDNRVTVSPKRVFITVQ